MFSNAAWYLFSVRHSHPAFFASGFLSSLLFLSQNFPSLVEPTLYFPSDYWPIRVLLNQYEWQSLWCTSTLSHSPQTSRLRAHALVSNDYLLHGILYHLGDMVWACLLRDCLDWGIPQKDFLYEVIWSRSTVNTDVPITGLRQLTVQINS